MGERQDRTFPPRIFASFMPIWQHLRPLCEVFRLWETDGGCPSELLPGQEAPLPQQLI
ncbi:hypothetical protein CGCA056_v005268 [Colletotrichum aenigma]|uniref:uncharacterized protein n=1 Tax=Colletotrichum aenigma TaxID=1215731 RepID=UPI0018731670|nr:uncharacterized protein CGCA056_v005268 [Colletotrichum aenigma]KAF5523180.1 hypothetical protein CGCA056_v005268 [Colletotrichum aenigma]